MVTWNPFWGFGRFSRPDKDWAGWIYADDADTGVWKWRLRIRLSILWRRAGPRQQRGREQMTNDSTNRKALRCHFGNWGGGIGGFFARAERPADARTEDMVWLPAEWDI